MNKYLIFLYVPIALGLDFYSTYWAAMGDIRNIIELHFLSSVFGKGFAALGFGFLLECLILLSLCGYYFYKKAQDANKMISVPKFKILKEHKRKKVFDLKQVFYAIPMIVLLLSTSHLVYSLNNFLLGFYLRGSSASVVKSYIEYVHIGGRVYYIHLVVLLIAILIMYVFSKRGKLKFQP